MPGENEALREVAVGTNGLRSRRWPPYWPGGIAGDARPWVRVGGM